MSHSATMINMPKMAADHNAETTQNGNGPMFRGADVPALIVMCVGLRIFLQYHRR